MTTVINFKEKEFFMVFKGLFQVNNLKKTDKMTYIYLSSICKDIPEHMSFANLKNLYEEFGVTRPTFKNVKKRLSEGNLVEKREKENDFHLLHRENLNLKGNFFFLHYAVLRSYLITPRQKLIYAYLMSRASGDEMKLEVSMKKISEKCSIRDDLNLRRDVQRLVSVGLISQTLKTKKYKGKFQYDKYEYKILEIPISFYFPLNDKKENIEDENIVINLIDKKLNIEDFLDYLNEGKEDILRKAIRS
ncbi:hypothetical protein ACVAMH_31405 [Bacillus zanthoxyli]